MIHTLTGFTLTSTSDEQPPAADAEWIPAVVPGGVHESLLAAGVIAHPYRDLNELDISWVEGRHWWYRTTFEAPADLVADERLRLRFNGLDGVATVWLNGQELGSQANQHRPAAFDVTADVRPSNELLVRFTPPFDGLYTAAEAEQAVADIHRRVLAIHPGAAAPPVESAVARLVRARRRKMTCSWGWDFAPRVPSIGLQSGVELLRERLAVLAGVHLRTTALDLAQGTATLAVSVDLEQFAGTASFVRITITHPSGRSQSVELPAAQRIETSLNLVEVQPWWTHDLGEQPLYTVTTDLLHFGEVLDSRTERVGIRTIELDRSPDPEGGRLFRLLLNGVPTFARGANWVPASMLVGSITDQTYRDLVATARRGEMTMIRVWGGGIYEPAAFYDACDELGVLVWQDFMFACDDYPDEDPSLVAEVGLEAVHQVTRLRNHACLALWAGNNEVQAIHSWVHDSLEPANWGSSFFHELLPEVVATHSPGAVYWPGSPWGEDPGEGVNGVLDGDRHAWEVWHGLDLGAGGPTEFASRGEAVHFHRYAYDHGKFISEFGIHASPELATLQRWTTPGALDLRNAAFDHRNKDNPKDKGYALMEHETGVPTTLEEYVDFSMACQAEGLKFGVEHYRRRQPHCSGTLVWQFNDVWPGFSWSVVDHDLVPKAGYYFLQRAFRPVVASFRTTTDGLELWVTNSGRVPVELDVTVEVAAFSGKAELEEKAAVRSEAGSSQVVWSTEQVPSPDQYAWVSSTDPRLEPNRAFFAPIRDLPLDGRVTARAVRTGPDTAEVELVSRGYSYFTRILTPVPGVVFDSNYLDLRDGERRIISVSGLPDDLDLAGLQVASTWQRPTAHRDQVP